MNPYRKTPLVSLSWWDMRASVVVSSCSHGLPRCSRFDFIAMSRTPPTDVHALPWWRQGGECAYGLPKGFHGACIEFSWTPIVVTWYGTSHVLYPDATSASTILSPRLAGNSEGLFTMVDAFSWCSHDASMALPWRSLKSSHCASMVFLLWCVHQWTPMGLPWNFGGCPS